jgi:hypothetical protein
LTKRLGRAKPSHPSKKNLSLPCFGTNNEVVIFEKWVVREISKKRKTMKKGY